MMNMTTTTIFDKTDKVKPYTYPHLIKYADAINASFWLPEHFTYDRDVLNFKVDLSDNERQIITRCMLAISQVENKVKTFWGRIDIRMPKTEIAIVGATFAHNEAIHMNTYDKLLGLLGLYDEFEKIDTIPCLQGRTKYLVKYLEGINSRSDKEFTKSLILFTLLIENVSLFSQFLIVSSFYKYKNVMTNFNSVIGATAREENLHGMFGSELIRIIRTEHPEWFDLEMETKIRRNVNKALKAEFEIIDWMFEDGELAFLPKDSIKEYLKQRFNNSLDQLGYDPEFTVTPELLEPTNFLEVQLKATPSFDFFNEKSTNYQSDSSFDEKEMW